MPHGVVDPDSACRAQRRAFLAGVGPDSPRADVQVASWSPATAPIFLVPGFLAPSKADDGAEEMRRRVYQYWGQAPALSTTESPVHCVWPGGLSSLHDRACEIFYQIKGGTVDYGEAHSSRFGHARFGRTYEGTHPTWSAQSPIHIVGHSLGGSTVRVLQHLLHVCAFPGHSTSADWICSLTAINAPLNGSLAAYALGLQEASAPDVVRFSPGSLLGSFVHVIAFLDIKPFGFDVGLQHWNLSFRGESNDDAAGRASCWRRAARRAWRAGRTLIMSLLVKSIVVQSEDNAAFDASVHAMASYNTQMGVAHDCTFYLSLVGDATDAHTSPPRAAWAGERQWYDQLAATLGWILATLQWVLRRALLTVISWLTARRNYQAVASSLSHVDGLDVAAFRASASDGLCCTFSQSHPRVGVCATDAEQRVMAMPAAASAMRRGVWHVQRHSQDHMGIVPFPVSPIHQRQTFAALFGRLRSLPAGPGARKPARHLQALPASPGMPRALDRLSPYLSCEAESAGISDPSALSDAETHGSPSLEDLQELIMCTRLPLECH